MSGLLVKSTVVMKENLQEMNARGVATKYPVLLGGAALTRTYVENDLDEIYEGDVRYAKDAFEGLKLMDRIMAVKRGETPEEDAAEEAKKAERKARRERSLRIAEKRRAEQGPEPDLYDTTRSDVDPDVPVPVPPFWERRSSKAWPWRTTCRCSTSGRPSSDNGGCVERGRARDRRTRNWWKARAGHG